MKTSHADWTPQTHTDYTWDTDAVIPLGPEGYPLALGVNDAVGTLMFRDLEENAEDGTYIVRWDGDGVLSCGLNLVSITRAAGVMECTMDFTTEFNNGLFVRIEWTNPADPVTNVRVFYPGFDQGVVAGSGSGAGSGVGGTAAGPWAALPFHPHLTHFLRPYPVLRFMDYMGVNEEGSGSWADRSVSSQRVYTGSGGVPLEQLVLLANLEGASPYFCLPVAADDDYATSFATLVRDQLRPDVDIYVELANEIWHTGFYGGQYAQAAADVMGGAYATRFCWNALRTKQISALFRAVFPLDQHRRLKFILSSQYVNSDATTQYLACPDTLLTDAATGQRYIHAIGLAAYFDPLVSEGSVATVMDSYYDNLNDTIAQLVVRVIFAACACSCLQLLAAAKLLAALSFSLLLQFSHIEPLVISLVAALHFLFLSFSQEHRDLIAAAGMKLVLYEGGPSGLGGGGDDDAVIAAHRNVTMEDFMYEAYTRVRDEVAPELLVHFGTVSYPSKYGSYNLVESYKASPQAAPKFRAFERLMEEGRATAVASPAATPAMAASCGRLAPEMTCDGAGLAGCSGSGACVSRGSDLGSAEGDMCVCLLGFSGEDCSQASQIDHSTCGYKCSFDRGECLQTGEEGIHRYFGCDCLPEYFGTTCSRFLCEDSCNYNGECIDADVCHCYPGFMGEHCEVDCGCGGHGRCDGGHGCICDDGYELDSATGQCVADCSWGSGKLCGCDPGCVFGNCVSGACECWAGYSGEACDVATGWRANLNSPVGTNVGTGGYGLESMYVNVMKHSTGEFVSVPGAGLAGSDLYPYGDEQYVWGDGQALQLDARGYLTDLQRGSWAAPWGEEQVRMRAHQRS